MAEKKMKRERVSTKGAAKKVPPLASPLSWAEKELIARVALVLRGEGKSWQEILQLLSQVHTSLPEKTVRTWVSTLVQDGHVFAEEKHSGRPSIVGEEEMHILVGWIFSETDSGKIITLDDAWTKATEDLELNVVKETIRLHLHKFGVETRSTGCATSASIPMEEKISDIQNFIKRLRSVTKKGTVYCSVDFTYTSHRTAHPTSLAGKGRKSGAKEKISRFTNCLITGVLSNGIQLLSILYTLNSNFRTDRKKTKRRSEIESHLEHVLAEAGVSDDRIVYDGKLEGEKGTFVAEYNDMVRDFLEHHKATLEQYDVIFLSDNGNAFKKGEKSIIEELGYGKHFYYPASVHQYLSPNDNRLHGVAKAVWRSQFKDFTDDVVTSVGLMKCLDDVSEDNIRNWFNSNLFLEGGVVQDEDARALISGRQSKWSELHDACIVAYENWAGIEEDVSPEERRLSSALDGVYYADN